MNQQELDERKLRFIESVVNEWAATSQGRLLQSLDKAQLVQTGNLRQSLKVSVRSAGEKHQGAAVFSMNVYGRIIDIQGYTLRDANKLITQGGKKKNPKRKRWYSKTMWGNLPPLVEKLTNGYAEFITEQVKQL